MNIYLVRQVYDGHSTDGDPLREYPKYNGSDKIPVRSTGTKMLVIFTSDSLNTSYMGWEAEYDSNPVRKSFTYEFISEMFYA